jgi:hypothetical protein
MRKEREGGKVDAVLERKFSSLLSNIITSRLIGSTPHLSDRGPHEVCW